MHEQPYHQMRLDAIHPSGAEEWYCPTCGRRFLMRWPPLYSKIILEPGDEYAIHSGGKGGWRMGLPTIEAEEARSEESFQGAAGTAMGSLGARRAEAADDQDPEIELSDELLAPWRNFIEGADFDRPTQGSG
jgi:hypothetical protein